MLEQMSFRGLFSVPVKGVSKMKGIASLALKVLNFKNNFITTDSDQAVYIKLLNDKIAINFESKN